MLRIGVNFMEKRRIWAVVCGAVRQEFELLSVLARLCEMRSEGLIEGIVLSTWANEVCNINNLINKLKYLNIYVVESKPIDDEVSKYANLNYIRQATQLNAALNFIPDDVFVLKCRTDFCVSLINELSSQLNDIDLTVPMHTALNLDFCYKIAIFYISTSHAFVTNDICYFGYKNDIKRLVLFESTEHFIGNGLFPDNLFFLSPFLHRFYIINEYIRTIDFWGYGRLFIKKGDMMPGDEIELPGVLNKFYALYFLLCYSCFQIIKKKHTENVPIRFHDIFLGNGNKNMAKSWTIMANDSTVLDKIINGKIEPSPAYQHLYDEICRMKATGYAQKVVFTQQDYAETALWGQKYFGLSPSSWIKNNRLQNVSITPRLSNNTIYDILFSDFSISKKGKQITNNSLANITHSKDYYNEIIRNLDALKNEDKNLYEKAAYTAARSLNSDLLCSIARSLYKGEISKTNELQARFIFDRYAQSPRFYVFPMAVKRFCSAYYYFKYIQDESETFAKRVYDMFISFFNISPEKSVLTGFADSIKELATEYVNNLISKYEKEENVAYLLSFLLEICEENPLTDGSMNALKEIKEEKYLEVKEKYENIGTSRLLV